MSNPRTNTTDYLHPQETNLLNVHKAMEYNANGAPVLRVSIGNESVEISGNVFIPGNIEVYSTPDNPVHSHITEVGTSDVLTVPWLPVAGNVTVDSGNITVWQGTTPWIVKGNVDVVGNISGITTLPAITGNVHVYGNVSVDNFPTNVRITDMPGITGNVSVTQGTSPWHIDGNVGLIANSTVQVSYPGSATTAFDEPLAITITPVIQADVVHGIDPDLWITNQVSGGNVLVTDNSTWQVSSGTSPGGYARLKTSRFLRYQPGQGALSRWTAAFTCTGTTKLATGVDNIYQLSGLYGREDGYAFGYSGDPEHPEIGVLHRYNGRVEIRRLSIDTAPTGTQTISVTLNGVVYNGITITAGTTTEAAAQIGLALRTGTASNMWDVDYGGNKITICYYTARPTAGTYSFSSSGTGTLATGTFTTVQAGVAPTDVWTYVDAWNGTPIDFDPSKLNVYSVDFRWLGAGRVRFFMENPATGAMTLVHTQLWSGRHTVPHLNKPSQRISYRAGSTSGATPSQNVTVSGASVFAGVEGTIIQTGHSEGWFSTDSTTRAKDSVWHLLSIQNPFVRNNSLNSSQLVIQDLSVAAQGNDPSVIFIVVNPIGTNVPLVFDAIPGPANTRIFAQYSNTLATEDMSQDNPANIQTLGINGFSQFNLLPYNFQLAPGDMISVFITSTNALTRTSAGMTWRVD